MHRNGSSHCVPRTPAPSTWASVRPRSACCTMRLPLFDLSPAAAQAWLAERLARPIPPELRNLSDGFRLPGRTGDPTPAAVLVPLVNRVEGLQVLLTQRSADLPDHP